MQSALPEGGSEYPEAFAQLCVAMLKIRIRKKHRMVTHQKFVESRCRSEFEKHIFCHTERNKLEKLFKQCTNVEKRAMLVNDLHDYDSKQKIKSSAIIRFIGELYKCNLLKAKVMGEFLEQLARCTDKKNTEYLCDLLTAIEIQCQGRNTYPSALLSVLTFISENCKSPICNRAHYMIQVAMKSNNTFCVANGSKCHTKKTKQAVKPTKSQKTVEGLQIEPMNATQILRQSSRIKGGSHGCISETRDSNFAMHADEMIEDDVRNSNAHAYSDADSWTSFWLDVFTGKRYVHNLFPKGSNNSSKRVGKNNISKKTNKLYMQVCDILVQLTPEKYFLLSKQIQNLDITTNVRIQCVVGLVFEKATDEPDLCATYAKMCGEICDMLSSTVDSLEYFKKLLAERCEIEFKGEWIDETGQRRGKTLKRKSLIHNTHECSEVIEMGSVGAIWFVGELFKQHLLPARTVNRCLNILLEASDGRYLEDVCTLLVIFKNKLTKNNVHFNDVFSTLATAVEKHHDQISERVHRIIQAVINLEKNEETQYEKEAEYKELQMFFMNVLLPQPLEETYPKRVLSSN